MKLNKSATELLNRYMLGVKRELGGRNRDDIAAEIESYIYDLLEERHPGEQEIGTPELEAVLKEMGSPRKVAGQYSPQRYLIGPRLFPIYWLVLRIVVAVVAGSLLLSLIIAAITNPPVDITRAFVEFLSTIWDGMLSAAMSITIVFVILEHASEGKNLDEIKELDQFKIENLPELPENEKSFSLIGTSIESVLGVFGLVFFAYLRGTYGALPVMLNPDTQMHLARIFTDNFMNFIPVILGLTGLKVACNITMLVQARHSSFTNWWRIILRAADMVLSGLMLQALPLITLDYFRQLPAGSQFVGMDGTANTVLAVILALSILGSLVEMIKMTVHEVRHPAY